MVGGVLHDDEVQHVKPEHVAPIMPRNTNFDETKNESVIKDDKKEATNI